MLFKGDVAQIWVEMLYFFVFFDIDLMSKDYEPARTGNPPPKKRGVMHLLKVFICSLCQHFEGVFLSFLFSQNQVY